MPSFKFFKVNTLFGRTHLHGLDTIRAASVMMGLLWHFMQITQSNSTLNLILSTGPWGGANPLFLVSGYLLGNQILSRYVQNKNVSLVRFYFRRALKTWPGYFVLILIVLKTPYFQSGETFPAFWKFMTFTQNFNLSSNILSHTWSLCIEEHFYLVLPLFSLLFLLKPKSKNVLLIVALFILLGLVLRGYLWFHYIAEADAENRFREYFNKIYYQTYNRLDGLVLGVCVAYLQNYLPEFWKKMMEQGKTFFKLGLTLCCLGFFMQIHRTDLVASLFVFPLIAFGYGFLLLAALSNDSVLSRNKVPGAALIATLSYALYLVHRPVAFLVERFLQQLHLSFSTELFFSVILGFLFSFITAYLLFILVERPILKFRDNIIPTIERK